MSLSGEVLSAHPKLIPWESVQIEAGFLSWWSQGKPSREELRKDREVET